MRIIPVLLLIAVPAYVASCSGAGAQKAAQKYTCVMHPQYVTDKPGDCPICGMKLVPLVADDTNAGDAKSPPPIARGPRKPLYYRSPMNPADTSPVPKKDGMGMEFVAVYPDDVRGASSSVPGEASVRIDAERRRLIGMKTEPVRRVDLAGGIRTVGRIVIDETRQAKVQPRFDGFIEKLDADYTGKQVKKGQRLASIYSPELLATEEELLLAARGRDALAGSGLRDASDGPRAKLRLLGIPEAQISAIERAGKPLHALDVLAPISGTVTVKNAVAGARVAMDQPLFEIVDLSTVWLLADVYESDLPRLVVGQSATATLVYWPERKWVGRVSYIFPTVDDKTRTVKVRIELANPKGELRPEMFADVMLRGATRNVLAVPEDAIIESGTRTIAFVDVGDGKLEPREVAIGVKADGLVEVRSGVREGEQVATGASFLLDSESRLKAAVQSMSAAHSGNPVDAPPTGHAGHGAKP